MFSVNKSMLYVLPPPRAPDPPSPWDSILCASGNSNSANVNERTPWADIKQMPMKPPPGAKVPNVKLRSRNNDPAKAVPADKDDSARASKSLSECYFAGKGTALVLHAHERVRPKRRASAQGSDIQQHLQSMFYLLRPEETLKMAVKLESVHPCRTRYLVVVSCVGRQDAEESCLLGIDCNERTTIGLVLRVLADTTITLDGDGGFSVTVCGRHHIFKPVSVQAMWSALQSLHKISSKAREQNYFQGGPTHDWVNYYDQRIESEQSCLNEWHAMDSLESRRPPSPDSIRTKPREREEAEMIIRATLKEIMMSVDLDEVTSKCIRNRLEEDLNMNLGEFKSFIDQEMLTILGQMDSPTEIFDHVYLGSEWNASNFEELQKNGVGHILNVTREIDNFFPGMFDYLNIRVYDDEKTDLLKHWDNTFKYITKARKEGSKVLVHCKMGVSRSASVVIAYAMKAYNWDFEKALKHVKEKRSCIKPNTSFLAQLETYQGILDAMKNKEKLQRSKSETNLKSPELTMSKIEKKIEVSETDSVVQTHHDKIEVKNIISLSGHDLRQIGARPKSWSPDNYNCKNSLLEQNRIPVFLSLENLTNKSPNQPVAQMNNKTNALCNHVENARNVLMPFNNGQSYSVSPNQIVHIPGNCKKKQGEISKKIFNTDVNKINTSENKTNTVKEKKGLVLNLTTQFEAELSKPSSPADTIKEENKSPSPKITTPTTISEKEIWDPGEVQQPSFYYNSIDLRTGDDNNVVWTSSAVVKQTVTDSNNVVDSSASKPPPEEVLSSVVENNISKVIVVRKEGDPFSNRLDRVFDREERKQQRNSMICPPSTDLVAEESVRKCPSRQSSWSSYDSAVVLGYQGETRDAPSRHSSWGSGDTRTLPSRNSSWGSYDMRRGQIGHIITEKDDKCDIFSGSSSGIFPYDRDEIPWHPGTVKRTKQKLEGNSETNKRVCSATPKTMESNSTTTTTIITGSLNSVQTHSSPSSIETFSDCPISSSLSSSTVDAFNNGMVHCRSSPMLCGASKKSPDNISSYKFKSKEIDILNDDAHINNLSNESRLSVSAPGSSSLSVISNDYVPLSSNSTSNVDKRGANKKTDFSNYISQCSLPLKNNNNKVSSEILTSKQQDNLNINSLNDSNNRCVPGIVKNLKKEFEAKTTVQQLEKTNGTTEVDPKDKLGSTVVASKTLSLEDGEDLSVKELVGIYEICTAMDEDISDPATIKPKPVCIYENKLYPNQNKNVVRYSCIEDLSDTSDKEPSSFLIGPSLVFSESESNNKVLEMRLKKPHITSVGPVASFVSASVVKAATKKQMQMRNREFHTSYNNMKSRNNHPAHNTM